MITIVYIKVSVDRPGEDVIGVKEQIVADLEKYGDVTIEDVREEIPVYEQYKFGGDGWKPW